MHTIYNLQDLINSNITLQEGEATIFVGHNPDMDIPYSIGYMINHKVFGRLYTTIGLFVDFSHESYKEEYAQTIKGLESEGFTAKIRTFDDISIKKKWLIKSDYDGGEPNAFVVEGSYSDAKREAVKEANLICGVIVNDEDKSTWKIKDYDQLMGAINDGDDDFFYDIGGSPIFKMSIDEV